MILFLARRERQARRAVFGSTERRVAGKRKKRADGQSAFLFTAVPLGRRRRLAVSNQRAGKALVYEYCDNG